MKRMDAFRGLLALLMGLAAGASVTGCGAQSTDEPDTSSHWLNTCKNDETCSGGHSCLCGVCTKTCESTSDCRGFGNDAECVEVNGCSGKAVCALESTFRASDAGTSVGDFIPSGCEFLTEKSGLEPTCRSQEDQCEQAKLEPVRRSYWLMLDEQYENEAGDTVSYSDDELERRQQCLVDLVDNMGLEASPLSSFVTVVGTWPEVQPLTIAVGEYYVECDDCEYCFALDEEACNLDAFCSPLTGQKVNLAQECLERAAFFECLPSGYGCDDAELWATLDDQCYHFSSICPTRKNLVPNGAACLAAGHEVSDLYAFDTCTSDSACVSPFENADSDETLPGCACGYDFGAEVCLGGQFFWCEAETWVKGYDGVCELAQPANCGALFESVEQCFEVYQACFEVDDGVCGLNTRSANVLSVIGADECQALGGTVTRGPKPKHARWIDVDPDSYCEAPIDPMPAAFCELLGGSLQCELRDSGSTCPDQPGDYDAYDVKDCENGEPGVCCLP